MSLTSPRRSSSVWLENPDIVPEDKSEQQQCSRCGDWQHKENYGLRNRKSGIRRKHCKGCQKLYEILRDIMGQKEAGGEWVVKLPDGTLMALVDVATAITRRGYRLRGTKRLPAKALASTECEEIAREVRKQGYPLFKIGSPELEAKGDEDV